MVEDAALRLLLLAKALPGAVLPLLARTPMPDDPDVALLHPRRSEIHRLVSREPGLSIQEITNALNIPYSEAHRHVEKLIACGLLEKRPGMPTRIYPAGKAPSAAETLANDATMAVAQAILEKADLTSEQLAEATGLARSTVIARLRRLQDAGFVRMRETEAAPVYRATPKLKRELSRN